MTIGFTMAPNRYNKSAHMPKGQLRLLQRRARQLFPELDLTEFQWVFRTTVWECRHCRLTNHPAATLHYKGNRVTLCTDWRSCDFRAAVYTSK